MSPKNVFITGATGYIGGDALFAVQEAQPTWNISVLIRNEEKGAQVKKSFPKVEVVIGGLDDYNIIKDAASKSDIVIHTAESSDHPGAAQAIADGLRAGHSQSNPGYYIHISGSGILTWYDNQNSRWGQKPLPEQSYDDLDGIDAIVNLPDTAWHRNVDKIVLAEAAKDPKAVKIAIVSPPTIYGSGRGPVNQRSRQVPLMIEMTLNDGAAPVIGDGLTEWDNVHLHDLSEMIVLLAKQANLSEPDSNEQEIFGPKGYHFCENGSHRWSNIADIIIKEAHKQGLVDGTETKQVSVDEAKERFGMQPLTWGLNSKGVARRARKYLGWTPKKASLPDSIPEMVRYEGERRKQTEKGTS